MLQSQAKGNPAIIFLKMTLLHEFDLQKNIYKCQVLLCELHFSDIQLYWIRITFNFYISFKANEQWEKFKFVLSIESWDIWLIGKMNCLLYITWEEKKSHFPKALVKGLSKSHKTMLIICQTLLKGANDVQLIYKFFQDNLTGKEPYALNYLNFTNPCLLPGHNWLG